MGRIVRKSMEPLRSLGMTLRVRRPLTVQVPAVRVPTVLKVLRVLRVRVPTVLKVLRVATVRVPTVLTVRVPTVLKVLRVPTVRVPTVWVPTAREVP